MAVTKEHILSEIRRTALQKGALGIDRFSAETGIKEYEWRGVFWARWNDALAEAGFAPNQRTPARTDDDLLNRLADLVKELGRFPVHSELNLKKRRDSAFPAAKTFRRFGNKSALVARLRKFCEERGHVDLLPLISDAELEREQQRSSDVAEAAFGFVYLLKSGRFYKIGRSNAVGRRERELAIQLPEKASVVHSVRTDDPAGIENYWHRRFETRRQNGEWFALTAADIAAFRRRKFM